LGEAAMVATPAPERVRPAPLNDTVGVAAPSALTAMFWKAMEMAPRLVPLTTGLYQFVMALLRLLSAVWMLPTSVAGALLQLMLPVVEPLMVSVKVPPVMAPLLRKLIVCTSFMVAS